MPFYLYAHPSSTLSSIARCVQIVGAWEINDKCPIVVISETVCLTEELLGFKKKGQL